MGSRCLCHGIVGKPEEQYCGELVDNTLNFCTECNGGRGCNPYKLPDRLIDPKNVNIYNTSKVLDPPRMFRTMYYLVAVLLTLSTVAIAGSVNTAIIMIVILTVFLVIIGLKGKLFDESNGNT
jgi:hypothetical protein